MENKYDDVIFFEELPPERQEEVRAALDDDPDLARAFTRWRRIRAAVRARIEAGVPDRRLLVLYALDKAGKGDALSPTERQTLARSRAGLEQVLRLHPGLKEGVARIQEDRVIFEAAWSAHFASTATSSRSERPVRADRPSQRSRTRRGASSSRRWAWRAGVAAALVLIAVLSLLFLPNDAERVVVTAGPDEIRQIEFADGSTVRLMAGSRLAYAASGAQPAFDRRVSLETGHAFFEVTSASRDFIVETPTARAVAFGTSFGIQVEDAETRVVLADGRLDVASRSAPEQVVTLQPGYVSRIPKADTPTEPVAVNVTDALAWTGLFIFRGAPMRTIAERLKQHYEMSIAVAPSLRDEGVTGTFERDQPLLEILRTITTALDARVVPSGDGYRIEANGSV